MNPYPRPKLTHSAIYHPMEGLPKPVLAIYHVAYLFRAPWYEPAANRDWATIPRILAGTWPVKMPSIRTEPPECWPQACAFDTEFYEESGRKHLVRYSIAWEDSVHVVEWERGQIQCLVPEEAKDPSLLALWKTLHSQCQSPRMVSSVLESRICAAETKDVSAWDQPKAFVSSMPSTVSHPKREEAKTGPDGDHSNRIPSCETSRGFPVPVVPEDSSSVGSRSQPPNREIPGLLVLVVQFGRWVDLRQYKLAPSSRCVPLTIIMHHAEADIDALAQILPPGTLVWIEDSFFSHSVLWADLDHDLDFVGSLYARVNRWKHLVHTNPRLYAGGDAAGTWDAWRGMAKELERDPRSKHVYYTYQLPLVPIIARARDFGARVNLERVKLAVDDLTEQQDDAEAHAQAVVGWPLNLGSVPQVAHQLYSIEKMNVNPISGRVMQ